MTKRVLSLLCVFALMTLIGCQDTAKKPATPQEPKKAESKQLTAGERRTMAYRLATLAKSVDGVKNSAVIVNTMGIADNLPPNTKDNPGNIGAPENIPAQKDQKDVNIDKNNSNKPKTGKRVDKDGVMVIIGLDLDKKVNMNRNKSEAARKKVMRKIKASDTRISQVIIMPDTAIVKNVNDIMAGIIDGEPIQSLENDIKSLNIRLKQQPPVF